MSDVLIEDFFGRGVALRRCHLGWYPEPAGGAGCVESRLQFEVAAMWHNVMLYHVATGLCYGLHFERSPIELREHALGGEPVPLACQVDNHTWEGGRVLQTFHSRDEVWSALRVEGACNLRTLIQESYVSLTPTWQRLMDSRRRVLLPHWHGPNRHLYADETGLPPRFEREARSNDPLEVMCYMAAVGYNVTLFDPSTRVYWGLPGECWPGRIGPLPYDATQPYEEWRWDKDMHHMREESVVCTFNTVEEIWREPVLRGRTLEEAVRGGVLEGGF